MSIHNPKLCVDVTPEQFKMMQDIIPHGSKKTFFQMILSQILPMMEEDNSIVYGVLLGKRVVEFKKISGHRGD